MKSEKLTMSKAARLLAMAVVLAAAVFAVFSCKDDDGGTPSDDPKTQTAAITGLFDNNSSATVTGYFTNAEWEGVPDKIKTAFNARFEKYAPGIKTAVGNVFATRDISIIVEKNPPYTKYSATLNGNTMRINYAILNNAVVTQRCQSPK